VPKAARSLEDMVAQAASAREALAKKGGAKSLQEKSADNAKPDAVPTGGPKENAGKSVSKRTHLFEGKEEEIEELALAAIRDGKAGPLSIAVRTLSEAGGALSQEDKALLEAARGMTIRHCFREALQVVQYEVDRRPAAKAEVLAALGLRK